MSAPTDLTTSIATLLAEPGDAGLEFSFSGTTMGEVHAMAAWLRENLPRHKGAAVCLAAEDRAVIAAALLASLAGGPPLILPYAFSAQALEGLQRATGAVVAISDIARDFPSGTEVLVPQRGGGEARLSHFAAEPEKELLCLYTGGSTGTPQIWTKTGINLFAESLFLADHFNVTPQDRIVATISPYHVYGLLYSVMLPLVSGAVVFPAMPSFPEEIIKAVGECDPTILVSVPAHYRALQGRSLASTSLKLAFSSAGVLAPEINREFCSNNGVEIVEIYGSTETGGIALRSRARGEEGFTPYPTVDWRIDGQRLLVRSPYLSRDLARNGDGFFVTGDRADVSECSGFVLRGRADSIAKVGGNRVDLEEIAGFLKMQPGVTDCLVLALFENRGRQHRIVAVVEGEGADIETLKHVLAARFEPYALPRTIKTVAKIPMKDNGKYDRETILRLFE